MAMALGLPAAPCLHGLSQKKHCHQQHDETSNMTTSLNLIKKTGNGVGQNWVIRETRTFKYR
eukprot:1149085-Pelagomonas_calceolata.AAC.1